MYKKVILLIVLMFSVTGCVTTTQKETTSIHVQQLNMRISQLERDVQKKDEDITRLENELKLTQNDLEKNAAENTSDAKGKKDISSVTSKEIQEALKNAGFYTGAIDGKIGENTKHAIKKFQEANGLNADGVVGSKTWSKLEKYL